MPDVQLDDLKEYLKILIDTEQDSYLLKQTKAEINDTIPLLEQSSLVIREPVKPAYPGDEPKPPQTISARPSQQVFILRVVGIVMLVFGVILTIMCFEPSNISDLGENIFFPVFCFAAAIICFGISGKTAAKEKSYAESVNKANREKYEHAMEAYRNNINGYKAQMASYRTTLEDNKRKKAIDEQTRSDKIELIRDETRRLNEYIQDNNQFLQKLYGVGILYPKYRNFVAVCSLYEYLCSGRCNTLEGSSGAYNIYEFEIRLDRIVQNLDDVLINLGAIRNNQAMLYTAIREGNRMLGSIVESTGRMMEQLDTLNVSVEKGNRLAMSSNELLQNANEHAVELQQHIEKLQQTSELTAYNTKRTERQLEYMNRMDYILGRNDSDTLFWNLPPT